MVQLRRKTWLRFLVYTALGLVVLGFGTAQFLLHYSPAPIEVRCTGSAEEMGDAYGRALGLPMKLVISGYLERGVCQNNDALIKQRYAAASGIVDQLPKPYADELKAVATSSNCDLDALAYGNSFLDMGNARAGCRSVVLTTDAGLLHGHNLDWDNLGGLARWTTSIIRRNPSDGRFPTVTLSFPGIIGALDTINSKGIALSFNQLGYGNSVPSEPVFIMMRRIAETCETFDGASNELRNAPPGMPFLITLSSSTEKRAAIFERLGHRLEERALNTGWVAGCNVAQKQTVGQTLLDEVIIAANPKSSASLKKVLSHPKVLADSNLYSVIFDFNNNILHVASGQVPAANEPFRTYPLFE